MLSVAVLLLVVLLAPEDLLLLSSESTAILPEFIASLYDLFLESLAGDEEADIPVVFTFMTEWK